MNQSDSARRRSRPRPDVVVVQRVLGKWLHCHSPIAKTSLGKCLLQGVVAATQHAPALNSVEVVVETYAGNVIGRFQCLEHETIKHLKHLICGAAPSFTVKRQLLYTPGATAPLHSRCPLSDILCRRDGGGGVPSDEEAGTGVGSRRLLTLLIALSVEQWNIAKWKQPPTGGRGTRGGGAGGRGGFKFSENGCVVKLPRARRPHAGASGLLETQNLLSNPGDSFCVRIESLAPTYSAFCVGVVCTSVRRRFHEELGRMRGSVGILIPNVGLRIVGCPTKKRQCVYTAGVLCGPEMPMFKRDDALRFQLRKLSGTDSGSGSGRGA